MTFCPSRSPAHSTFKDFRPQIGRGGGTEAATRHHICRATITPSYAIFPKQERKPRQIFGNMVTPVVSCVFRMTRSAFITHRAGLVKFRSQLVRPKTPQGDHQQTTWRPPGQTIQTTPGDHEKTSRDTHCDQDDKDYAGDHQEATKRPAGDNQEIIERAPGVL